MRSEDAAAHVPTRRAVIQSGSALAAAGLLAGCTGGSGSTPASAPTETGSTQATTAETPYSVTMSPMGEVEFERVPERIFAILSSHADMALALGRGDDVNAVYAAGYTDSLTNAFTAPLDGVSVDWADLYSSWNPSREKLYDLDSDVHLADPANVLTMGNWDQSGVDAVTETVGPWFGNTFSADHGAPPDAYADGYEYYTLWETFRGVAEALREQTRYEALRRVRDDLLSTIEDGLPPESERPSVAMVLNSTADETMWVYRVNAAGYHASHTRPLGAVDAFEGAANGANVGPEALFEADPDVLLVLGGVVDAHDMAEIRTTLESDPVTGGVTAVEDGRVYAQGTRHQGPLVNLFQLEMGAKQLYPDEFGEWPTYVDGPYPSLSPADRLFDHDHVADVINGNI